MSDPDGIRQLLATYCRYVDHGYGGRVAELFTDDGCFLFGAIEVRGRAGLEAFYEERLARVAPGRHVSLNHILEPAADGWHVTSTTILFGDEGGPAPLLVADFDDLVVRDAGRWRFAERRGAAVFAAPSLGSHPALR